MNIISVIVTYNRLELLQNTIQAVLKQTRLPDHIIIVNNASTDDTADYLKIFDDNPVFTCMNESTNLGGAGGFHKGVKRAYESGADWVWIMDDDSEPAVDALEKLIYPLSRSLENINVGFLASQVLWKDNEICYMNTPIVDRDWPELISAPEQLVRVWSASFVSLLVNAKAIGKVGYPVSEFFIWYDDSEYTSRISSHFKNFFVPASIARHLTPTNLRPMDYSQLNESNCWKYCYGVRNECAVLVKRSKLGAAKGLFFALRQLARSYVFGRSVVLSGRIFLASLKGIFFRYQKLIVYPEQKRVS
jgi:glycosyltransferase involved in cell wall biosynthesis